MHGKSYYPTRRMLQNAEVIEAADPVLRLVHPVLERLRDRTGESVLLAQHAEHNIMILDVVESVRPWLTVISGTLSAVMRSIMA